MAAVVVKLLELELHPSSYGLQINPSFPGIYTWLFENLSGKDGAPPGFFVKAGIGMAAGCCGAFVGTPAEVALIRMTSDGNLPADQRRNYKNAFEALVRIGQGFQRF